jgi:hypothetical protein
VLPFVSNEVTRPKDRLILYFTASCLSSIADRSTRLHIKLSLHWASLHHHVYVRQYTGILAPSFYSERIHDLKFLLPVNVQPPQPLRRHSAH